jgi:oligo-alginate lyase
MKILLALAAGLLALFGTPTADNENYLLVNATELAAAKSRAERYPWAKQIVEKLVANADRATNGSLDVPDRGGQWTHWYSCPKDGARLVTQSPTQHRCTVCGTVYTGEPYDSVVLSGIHSRNSAAIRDCGLAFRLTGEDRYAQFAARLLIAYADRYRDYRLHNTNGEEKTGGAKIMAQTLDESVWLIPVTWGYALVRSAMAQDQRKHVEADLLLPAADVIRGHKMGIHNIQCWKNSAVGLVGYTTAHEELVREAIEDGDRGFLAQIERGVTEDGLWWEGSLGYHHYTMQALWPLAEAARHAGRDLYSDRFRRLWDAPLAMAFPNGDPPGFNDSPGSSVLRIADLYELAAARWRRPEYEHLISSAGRDSIQSLLYGPERVEPGNYVPLASTLLRDAGFAVLRVGGTAAAVRFGRHGGGHGHPDQLNLVTFGGGRGLGLDPGSINYGVPLHREWYRSTIAHNTVSVDGKIQDPEDGRLESWDDRPGEAAITMSCDSVYPGVQMRRTIRLPRSGRIEDRFECLSAEEHEYDWAFHVPGTISPVLELQPRAERLGDRNGYEHISRIQSARTDGDFSVVWTSGPVILRLSFVGVPGTEVLTGTGPGRNPADGVPVLVVRRRARKTVFEVTHTIETLAQ